MTEASGTSPGVENVRNLQRTATVCIQTPQKNAQMDFFEPQGPPPGLKTGATCRERSGEHDEHLRLRPNPTEKYANGPLSKQFCNYFQYFSTFSLLLSQGCGGVRAAL